MDNVWILTITSPNPNGEELSPFHTRALAVDKEQLDHTAVMDWYPDEIKDLAGGDEYLFEITKSFKRSKRELIACLSDRPENVCCLTNRGLKCLDYDPTGL